MNNSERAPEDNNVFFLPPVSARAMDDRDRRLRAALVFALENSTDGKATGCLFGALASLVESDEDAEALKLAQAGILALVGRFALQVRG